MANNQCLCNGKSKQIYHNMWIITQFDSDFELEVNDEYGMPVRFCPQCGRDLTVAPENWMAGFRIGDGV